MREKNTVTLEEIGNNKVKKEKTNNNFGKFFRKKLVPFILVSIVICLLFTIAFIIPAVNQATESECTTVYCSDDEITISENFLSRMQVILLTLFAAIVPYFYLPFLGLLSYMYNEIFTFANVININGYMLGIIRYIVPFILNTITISLVTATGVYLTKIFTAKFVLDRSKNMNFTNFKLRLYEMLKKYKKQEELNAKQDEKLKKWKKRLEKIQWKNVAIVLGAALILQLVSVILEKVLV